jgi:hypothetical protein
MREPRKQAISSVGHECIVPGRAEAAQDRGAAIVECHPDIQDRILLAEFPQQRSLRGVRLDEETGATSFVEKVGIAKNDGVRGADIQDLMSDGAMP